MNRRHRNNLGTGIRWGYNYGDKYDPHWKQNSQTGGWFYVEDITEYAVFEKKKWKPNRVDAKNNAQAQIFAIGK